MNLKKKSWFIRLSSFEYWPSWVFYLPVCFQYVWLVVKTGNLFFFLKTNPGIDGFILMESKHETLKLVPELYLPKTIFLEPGVEIEKVEKFMKENKLSFPLILKPNIGCRGFLVKKIEDRSTLVNFLRQMKINYLLQEYIDLEEEVGVFYYRLPNEIKGHVSSLTLKEFLEVTGDGVSTLKELVYLNPRAILQVKTIKKNFLNDWSRVLEEGERLKLGSIGNHSKGTKFIDGRSLITNKLEEIFNNLTAQMKGFYFGRFDIKTSSLEDLSNGLNFKILEVNSVGAEPTHMYDPKGSIFEAWGALLKIWQIKADIAKQNMKYDAPTLKGAYAAWRESINYKKLQHQFSKQVQV